MAPTPKVTTADLSLSGVLLFLLLALVVRAELSFHPQNGVQPRRQRAEG
jgi:hypothetical protein